MAGLMGSRQVVRHWFLVPAFRGSNPFSPAKLRPARKSGFLLGSCKYSNPTAKQGVRALWTPQEVSIPAPSTFVHEVLN
jgi:hypothetical protein